MVEPDFLLDDPSESAFFDKNSVCQLTQDRRIKVSQSLRSIQIASEELAPGSVAVKVQQTRSDF